MSSGGAADLLARLRRIRLIDEMPASRQGRGRPTTILCPHAQGPLVLMVELGSDQWRLAQAGIDGVPQILVERHQGRVAQKRLFEDIAEVIADHYQREPERVCAVAVSVTGTVSDSELVQFTPRGWHNIDLTVLMSQLPSHADLPLLIGNDATLAGLAEARSGAAYGASTALHLIVVVGLGGVLVVDGEPVVGARGAAGEYGHIPFGDRSVECPCGARGCWDLAIDGRALARHLNDPEPADSFAYAVEVLQRRPIVPKTAAAIDAVATSLGSGIAGLVNLHDPEIVTLGGLAPLIRDAAPDAFDSAYHDGLMTFRKSAAPPVRSGQLGAAAPLYGAAALGLDRITTEAALFDWAQRWA
jgi:predicted NBD/HSP70 family sugar kinase